MKLLTHTSTKVQIQAVQCSWAIVHGYLQLELGSINRTVERVLHCQGVIARDVALDCCVLSSLNDRNLVILYVCVPSSFNYQ